MEKAPVFLIGPKGYPWFFLHGELVKHPWFDLKGTKELDPEIQGERDAGMRLIREIESDMKGIESRAFCISFLDPSCAPFVEPVLADKGFHVISCGPSYRLHPLVPLLIPEVNCDHLRLTEHQKPWQGLLVSIPDPIVNGLATTLHLLTRENEIQKIVATLFLHDIRKTYHEIGISTPESSAPSLSFIHQVEGELRKLMGWMTGRSIAEYPGEIHLHVLPCTSIPEPYAFVDIYLESKPSLIPEIIHERLKDMRLPEIVTALPHARAKPLDLLGSGKCLDFNDLPPASTLWISSPQGSKGHIQMCLEFDLDRCGRVDTPLAVAELLFKVFP